jgi:queuine/archaeosine tRNA-ribosyltransferase
MSMLFNWHNGHHIHALVGVVRATICDDGFWQQCENFKYMVELVVNT